MTRRPSEPPPHALPPTRHPDAPAPGTLLASHYRQCFGCGPDHPTGLHLSLRAGYGCTIDADLVVTEHHQGAPGLAHGGLLAAAFDEALGAVTWLLRTPVVTVHLETDYLAPVPVGATVHLRAECYAVAGRKVYSRATGSLSQGARSAANETAVAASDRVAVQANAVFVSVPLEHFRTHGRSKDIDAFIANSDQREVLHAFEVNP